MYSNIHHGLIYIQLISFQDSVPRPVYKNNDIPDRESCHHLITNKELKKAIIDSYNRNPKQFQFELQSYINHKKIQTIVSQQISQGAGEDSLQCAGFLTTVFEGKTGLKDKTTRRSSDQRTKTKKKRSES